jgi:hypothetical protein
VAGAGKQKYDVVLILLLRISRAEQAAETAADLPRNELTAAIHAGAWMKDVLEK